MGKRERLPGKLGVAHGRGEVAPAVPESAGGFSGRLEQLADAAFPDPYLCRKCGRFYPYLDLMGDPGCECGSDRFVPIRDEARRVMAEAVLRAAGCLEPVVEGERKASNLPYKLKRWHEEHSASAPELDCPHCRAEGWFVPAAELARVEEERDRALAEIKAQNGWAHDMIRRAEDAEAELERVREGYLKNDARWWAENEALRKVLGRLAEAVRAVRSTPDAPWGEVEAAMHEAGVALSWSLSAPTTQEEEARA